MRASTVLSCVALLTLTGAAALHAQAARPDLVGSRVRITLAPTDSAAVSRILVGDLAAVGDSTLSIRGPEAGLNESIAISRIHRFEVWAGRDRAAGAGFGALVGVASGLAIGLVLGDDCSSSDFICFDRSDTAAGGALLGAGLGVLIGGIVGRGDRWRTAELPVSVGVMPLGAGGVRLAATIGF